MLRKATVLISKTNLEINDYRNNKKIYTTIVAITMMIK